MKQLIYILLAGMLMASCVKEVKIDEQGLPVGKSVEGVLTLEIPGGGFKETARALTENDEFKVEEVQVLVFKKPNAGTADDAATFAYRASTTLVNGTGANKSFKVSVFADDINLQQFVIFANASAEVTSAVTGFTVNTTTKAAAMAALVMTKSGAWNTSTGTFDPLPMWGETTFRPINTAADATATVNLLRSVARIDVKVASSASSDFTLTGVWLYNSSTKGRLVPVEANWSASPKLPSQPTAGWTPNASEINYTSMLSAGKLERAMYVFEAPASTGSTVSTAPCLVVKGSWNGETEDYYRIDFYNEPENRFLSLLRNHLYDVQITGVSGRGYGSLAEAMAAGFANITAVTHEIYGGGMGNVVWDGRNYLSVDNTDFTLYPEAQSVNIKVKTNYTGTASPSDGGWNAVVESDGSGWLTITGGTGSGAGDEVTRTLTLDVAFNNVGDRAGTVTIMAGRLKQTITVFQKIDPELSIEVGESEMIFSALSPQSQSLRVEWQPQANPCNVTLIPVSGYPSGLTFASLPSTITNDDGDYEIGAKNLSLVPQQVTGLAKFAERRSTLRVTANASDGSTKFADVLLRQFEYAIDVANTRLSANTIVCQLGTSYDLTVRCNSLWNAVVANPSLVTITSTIDGLANNTSGGEIVTFKTTDQSAYANQSTTITFQNTITGQFSPQVITVLLQPNLPNCYILNPRAGAGNTVNIPVAKAYKMWQNDVDLNTDLGAILPGVKTTELLWQDELGLIASVGTLSTQDGSAVFTVAANTSGLSGNAVVVFKIDGDIYWSWHIWVVDGFDPEQNTGYNATVGQTIMDRNLGAIRSTPLADGDIGVHGLLYQWGRKDPFPGASQTVLANNSTSSKPIYDTSGLLTEGAGITGTGVKKEDVSVINNLPNAFHNPLTFYTATIGANSNGDWYTTNMGVLRGDRWDRYLKTEYDPCPDGWMVGEAILAMTPLPLLTTGGGNYFYDIQMNNVGYFTLQGYRAATNGNLYSVGPVSYIWNSINATGGSGGSEGGYANLSIEALAAQSSSPKASGSVVRCVKIQ